jgi:hypothetical protein
MSSAHNSPSRSPPGKSRSTINNKALKTMPPLITNPTSPETNQGLFLCQLSPDVDVNFEHPATESFVVHGHDAGFAVRAVLVYASSVQIIEL